MTFADRCNLKSSHALLPILFEKIQHLSLGFLVHDAENAVIILILLGNSIGMKEHNKIQMRKKIDSPFLHASLFTVSQYSRWRARREHFSLLRILPNWFRRWRLETNSQLTRLSRINNFMTPKKNRKKTKARRRRRWGYSQTNWMRRPAFRKALKTKICDYPHPIYDLTKIWVPYLNPDLIPCFSPASMFSNLVRADVKNIEKRFYSWSCFLRQTSIQD